MTSRLTKKQEIYVNELVMTDNGTKAALKAYDTESENTAAAISTENLRKPKIVEAVNIARKSLAEAIPDDLLTRVHIEGLNATTRARGADGEMVDVPDQAIRHKFLETGYELKQTIKQQPTGENDLMQAAKFVWLADMLNARRNNTGDDIPGDGAPPRIVG